ncbi:MmgE/PrpD family protein [Pseudogemmobacter sonorensis]|uniref:MmgE/PrpD family protein n=1 Tax=Pseudogemmobacter sonorensis TaxID=2989681 RepID=UPI0036C951B9
MTGGVSDALASFAAGAVAVPEAAIAEAKRSILNGLATGLAGSADPETLPALRLAERFCATRDCGLIGRVPRLDALGAAFVNALTINVHDFDDTHPGTILHPTAPVLPVLLALSEIMPVGGRAFLEAFVIGVEVECRIANAVSPGHYRRGWHITATCGIFGATAAAGRILGLDAARMRHAFGIASAQSSGLVETLGTMAKSIGVGNAAQNGLRAAFLAQDGMQGPALPLEGPRGFLRVTCEAPRAEILAEGLGESWEILRNTYKPYPCGVVLNPVIEAALEMAAEGIGAEGLARATVIGHPLLADRADRPEIRSGREAQVSAQHAVAVTLLRRAAGLPEFSDAAVADPEVAVLRARVGVLREPAMPVGAAELVLDYADGRRHSRLIAAARGDSSRPLTTPDIKAKLARLAADAAPLVDVETLIATLETLAASDDASDLIRACRPAA